jgi:two-component system nitrate/nitrite response regulator NarP
LIASRIQARETLEPKRAMARKISVLLADQHQIVREGLRFILRGFRIVGETESGREAVRLAKRLKPDVVMTGISLAMLNGLEAARQIMSDRPETRVLVLTALDDAYHIEQAVRIRVSGYILKSTPISTLANAVRAVYSGKSAYSPAIEQHIKRQQDLPGYATSEPSGLTGQQIEVLELIALDFQNKQIAGELRVSEKTVDKRVQRIMKKLNLHSRVALSNFVRSAGRMAGQ